MEERETCLWTAPPTFQRLNPGMVKMDRSLKRMSSPSKNLWAEEMKLRAKMSCDKLKAIIVERKDLYQAKIDFGGRYELSVASHSSVSVFK